MKSFLLVISLLALLTLTGTVAFAQNKYKKTTTQSTELLTNQSIIDLSTAGLDKDLIISKIQTTPTKFDLSTNGLIALKKAKVDNDIIKTMINKGADGSTKSEVMAKPVETHTSSLPNLDIINQVYQLNTTTNNSIPLEKVQADQKTKNKAFGYGGATVSYVINGERSSVRLSSADNAVFVINTGGSAPELTLYKLEAKKGTREAITMKAKGAFNGAFGSKGAVQSGENTINYNITQLKSGIYQITPANKLESGEYFFAAKATLSSMNIDVYAFGID